MSNCVCAEGAIEALRGPQEPINRMVGEYEKRRKVMLGKIRKMERVSCNEPEGALFVFPDFSDSKRLSEFLIEDAGVACSPESVFGTESGEGHLRLNYAEPIEIIREGLQRIRPSLEKTRKAKGLALAAQP